MASSTESEQRGIAWLYRNEKQLLPCSITASISCYCCSGNQTIGIKKKTFQIPLIRFGTERRKDVDQGEEGNASDEEVDSSKTVIPISAIPLRPNFFNEMAKVSRY